MPRMGAARPTMVGLPKRETLMGASPFDQWGWRRRRRHGPRAIAHRREHRRAIHVTNRDCERGPGTLAPHAEAQPSKAHVGGRAEPGDGHLALFRQLR